MATPKTKRGKRSFSGLTAPEAFALIGRGRLPLWKIDVPPRDPSPTLLEVLRRLESFALTNSEAGKLLLVDALLAEIVPNYPNLRVWKGEPLETDTLIGSADYLIAPFLDYFTTPFLCAVEAKKDDFEAGEIQCLGEMYACRERNKATGLHTDVYGIVSNGQGWVFYAWTADDSEFKRTDLYGTEFLPRVLAAIDHVCALCDAQVVAIQNGVNR